MPNILLPTVAFEKTTVPLTPLYVQIQPLKNDHLDPKPAAHEDVSVCVGERERE